MLPAAGCPAYCCQLLESTENYRPPADRDLPPAAGVLA